MKYLITMLLLIGMINVNAQNKLRKELTVEINSLRDSGHINSSAYEQLTFNANYKVGNEVEDKHHYIEEFEIEAREALNSGDMDSIAAKIIFTIIVNHLEEPNQYIKPFNTFNELRVQILGHECYRYSYFKD